MRRIFLSFLSCMCCLAISAQAKYVFYFIGDGMGPNQVLGAEMLLAEQQGRIGYEPLLFTQFPMSGMARTYSANSGVTDSAAGGTALSTGKKTTNGFVGVLPDSTSVPTIAEILKRRGMAVAICTSVSIDHATPACFYAHEPSRERYYEIGTWLPKSNFDFFAGAGFRKPQNKKDKHSPNLYSLVEGAGYTMARGFDEYIQLRDSAQKMILIQKEDGLPQNEYKSAESIGFKIDQTEGALTLEQITRAALDFTPRENGFFMMIEGGMIDWGCHNNDAKAVWYEIIEMDKAIRVAYDFYLEHPDETLIVITADHETGGLSMGRNDEYVLTLKELDSQQCSGFAFEEKVYAYIDTHLQKGKLKKLPVEWLRKALEADLGFYSKYPLSADEEQAIFNCIWYHYGVKKQLKPTLYANDFYSLQHIVTRLMDKQAHIEWSTSGHSAANVPVIAIGAGAELFSGWQDNTDIMPKILKATEQK